jgi:hypothetical protein
VLVNRDLITMRWCCHFSGGGRTASPSRRTWSHCIGDLGNTSIGVAGTNYMIPYPRASRRGYYSSNIVDRRQLFNLSAVYETPRAYNTTLRAIAGAWQVYGILRLRSGAFLGVTSGLDQVLSGAASERPNQVLPNAIPTHQDAGLAQPAGIRVARSWGPTETWGSPTSRDREWWNSTRGWCGRSASAKPTRYSFASRPSI